MAGLPDAYTEYTLHKSGDGYFATVTVDLEKWVRDMVTRYFVEKEDAEAERQLAELGFVKVVRCRDCKHLIAHGSGCEYWDYCDIESMDGFCSWGERITANGGDSGAVR